MRLALLYTALAAIAILVNIGTQSIFVRVFAFAHVIPASVAAGTVTGLVAKYVLDRRYIFTIPKRQARAEWRSFVLYAGTGAVTTAIFWGTEFAFHLVFQDEILRYVGGAIGLASGYVLKYRLDRDYVFGKRALPPISEHRSRPERPPIG